MPDFKPEIDGENVEISVYHRIVDELAAVWKYIAEKMEVLISARLSITPPALTIHLVADIKSSYVSRAILANW